MTALALLRECATPVDVAEASYEIVGAAGRPVVAVLGGISASRHATSSTSDPRPGWWEDIVGDGRAIDTAKFRVLSIDYLAHATGCQPVTTDDQARALAAEIIRRTRATSGAGNGVVRGSYSEDGDLHSEFFATLG